MSELMATAGASSWSFLLLGLALGLLHALDADHVMAVSSLAIGRQRSQRSLSLALQWAAGHGATLLLLGAAALVIGLSIPAALSSLAETGVGVLLIGLGLWVLWPLCRSAFLPAPPQRTEANHSGAPGRRHGAVFVGALHGLAGSAPILALVPAVARGSALLGVAYLAAFSLGVLVSMAVFGGLLTRGIGKLAERADERGLMVGRALTAFGSIAVGGLLLVSSA